MTAKTIYYVLYLITLPDIEAEEHAIHRIAYEDLETCEYHAFALNQRLDPIARKPNCAETTEYYRQIKMPLRAPKELR